MLRAVLLVAIGAVHTISAADFAGKWSGTMETGNEPVPVYLTLNTQSSVQETQHAEAVTGTTAIGDESKTVPIEKVEIQGERLSFEIHNNAGQSVRFQFTPTRTFLVGESTIGPLNSRVCLSPQQDGGATTGHDNCDRVYNYGGANSGPMLLQRVSPEVPSDSFPANIRAAVVQLSFEIGVDGTATNIKVLRSSGLGLDEKAVETVKQWRFKPARKDGMPVAVPMTLDFVIRKAG